MKDLSLPSIVEALIFASDLPLSKGRISTIIGTIEGEDVAHIVDELNRSYELGRKPLQIVELAGGYLMVTKEEYARWIGRLFSKRRKPKLSQAALETVAIIAYKQPVARLEMERIRGVNVDSVLKSLLERNLIRVVGRDHGIGRPYLFGTTSEFLSHFGLKKISDLPDYDRVRKGITPLQMDGSGIIESLEEKTKSEEEGEFSNDGANEVVEVHLPGREGIEAESGDDDFGGES